GLPGHPQTVAGAALAGLAGMTRQLAVEWGRLGIRVNMVEAGIVGPDSEQDFDVLRRVPLARAGTPEEIAEACYYLISRASSYVTGAVLPVDGGFLAT
ncbi:SDR family NAD(P)-dependent oxidoreductase, partial [Leucobacter soli]